MDDRKFFRLGFSLVGVLGGISAFGLYAIPHYSVWQQKMQGEAELARAQQNRQIKVSEAQADLESSKMKAQADVERAKGVAEANQIIGTSLQGNEAYLRYLWIERLTQANQDVIYIPTEAGLPILESQRLSHGSTRPATTFQDPNHDHR